MNRLRNIFINVFYNILRLFSLQLPNDYLELSIDGHYEPQLVPKLLVQVSVRELHNSMVIPPEEGGLKEATNAYNNIIMSDSIIWSILPPQLKKMSAWYRVMGSCECCISAKSIHSSLISWPDCYFRKLNNLSHYSQNRRSGKNSNRLFETYKNSIMPYGHHIYATAVYMEMATMFTYPQSHHVLPHCKCVLRCCYNFSFIDLPYQE